MPAADRDPLVGRDRARRGHRQRGGRNRRFALPKLTAPAGSKPILVATVAVFLLAIAGITAFELLTGQSVSGGQGTTISQVGDGRSGGSDTPRPASSTDTSTGPTTEPSTPPSTEPSTEPSSEPSQVTEPTTAPSPRAQPSTSGEPSASSEPPATPAPSTAGGNQSAEASNTPGG